MIYLKRFGGWAWAEFKALGRDVIKLEVAVKALLAAAFGGAVGAASDYYAAGHAFVGNAEHVAQLKATALSGAVIGLLAYLKQSPRKPQ